jgi:elongation factor 2
MLKMLESLEIALTSEEKEFTGKLLLKTVLSKWISAADTILEMMVVHLPSPRAA